MRHPKDMSKPEVESFLTMLANERQVSPATHRQALNALLFLYKQVIGQDLEWMNSIGRPPERKCAPVVLTMPDVQSVLGLMDGVKGTLAKLLYGTGMRLAEGLSLPFKDVDFDRKVIVVCSGKGDKDRVVMLPVSLVPVLTAQLAKSRSLWASDRASGHAGVFMPPALEAKYPRAGQSWAWHWVFPSPTLTIEPRSGVERRHHLFEERLGRKRKIAVEHAAIAKHVSAHTLRHSFATHMLQSGTYKRTVQEILGHGDVSTTMIYTHVLKVVAGGAKSPLDALTGLTT
jgi:integron integrase